MSMPQKPTPLADILGLREYCADYGLEFEDIARDAATITDPERGNTWTIYRVEAWIQIKASVLKVLEPTRPLCLTIMKLHTRLLGCRFSMENDNVLVLCADIFPHDQTGSAIGATISQMQWIVDQTYDLLCSVQETGIAADENAINQAFDFVPNVALH